MFRRGLYKEVKIVISDGIRSLESVIDDCVCDMESKNWALDSCQLVMDKTRMYANLTFVILVSDED